MDQIDGVMGGGISTLINAKTNHFIGNNIPDQMITGTQIIMSDT